MIRIKNAWNFVHGGYLAPSVRALRKSRRIAPGNVDNGRKEIQRKKEIKNPFTVIFNLATLIGLPVSFALLSKRFKSVKVMLVAWSAVLTTAKTLLVALQTSYNDLIWTSPAIRYVYHMTCLGGYLLTWLFIAKSVKIARIAKDVISMSLKLNPGVTFDTKRIGVYLTANVFFIVCLVTIQTDFFFFSQWDSLFQNIKDSIPFPSDSRMFHLTRWMVNFSTMSAYTIGYLTLYIALFLSASMYRHAARLYEYFGEKIVNDVRNEPFTEDVASENTILFKKINDTVEGTDEAFNVFAGIIYAYVVNGVFTCFSILLSHDKRLQTPFLIGYAIGQAISTMILFFYLTYSGDQVSVKWKVLKKKLIKASHFVFRRQPDVQTLLRFHLLSQNIKTTVPHVTCLGMFNITKEFVLSVIGSIISYGVLLYQMGATEDV